MCIKLAEFRLVPGALESIKTGTVTDSFERVIFAAIAITGIVSGICKGSNQCAIAHKFYEECRSFFYENTLNFLHGCGRAFGTAFLFRLGLRLYDKRAYNT